MLVSYLYTGLLEKPARNELELFERLLQDYGVMPNYYHYKSALDSKGTDKRGNQKHGTRRISYEIIGNRQAEKVFATFDIGQELSTGGIMKHKSPYNIDNDDTKVTGDADNIANVYTDIIDSIDNKREIRDKSNTKVKEELGTIEVTKHKFAYNIDNFDTKVAGGVDKATHGCTDIVDNIDHTREISGRSKTNYFNTARINKDYIKEELGTGDPIMEHKSVYNIENDNTKVAGDVDNATHGCSDIVDNIDDKRATNDRNITNNFNTTSANKHDEEDEYNYINSVKIDAVLEQTNDDIDGGEGAEEKDISNADKCKNVDYLYTTITNKGDDESKYNYESHDDKIDAAVLEHANNDINDDSDVKEKDIGDINDAVKSKNVDHSGDALPLNYLFSISVPHMKHWGDSKLSALGPTVDNLTEQNANKSNPRKQMVQSTLGRQSNLQDTVAAQQEERHFDNSFSLIGKDFNMLLQNMADQDHHTKTNTQKPKDEANFKMESPNQYGIPSCSDCDQTFESHTDLNKHICQRRMDSVFPRKTRACSKEKVFYCPMCNMGCSDLNEHICDMEMDFVFPKKKRPYNKKKVLCNARKVYYCPECNEGCPSRKELNHHMFIHNGENKCPLCGKIFIHKFEVASHLRSHVGGKYYFQPIFGQHNYMHYVLKNLVIHVQLI